MSRNIPKLKKKLSLSKPERGKSDLFPGSFSYGMRPSTWMFLWVQIRKLNNEPFLHSLTQCDTRKFKLKRLPNFKSFLYLTHKLNYLYKSVQLKSYNNVSFTLDQLVHYPLPIAVIKTHLNNWNNSVEILNIFDMLFGEFFSSNRLSTANGVSPIFSMNGIVCHNEIKSVQYSDRSLGEWAFTAFKTSLAPKYQVINSNRRNIGRNNVYWIGRKFVDRIITIHSYLDQYLFILIYKTNTKCNMLVTKDSMFFEIIQGK